MYWCVGVYKGIVPCYHAEVYKGNMCRYRSGESMSGSAPQTIPLVKIFQGWRRVTKGVKSDIIYIPKKLGLDGKQVYVVIYIPKGEEK